MLMGERRVHIGPGELLIVENMKLHRILDIPELNTRVVVISFMSNFVYAWDLPRTTISSCFPSTQMSVIDCTSCAMQYC